MRIRNWLNILLCIFAFQTNDSFAKILRIAGIPEAPLRYYDKNKKLKGIDIEIIELVFKQLKIPYKVILLQSSPGLKKIYQEKSADMILSFSKTQDRERYLDFALEPHMKISWHFFVKKNNKNKYKFDTFADLKGARVGVTYGFAYTVDFWNSIETGILKPFYEHQNSLQMQNLLKNKVDLVLLNKVTAMHHAKQNQNLNKISFLENPVKTSLYYNSFVRNSDFPGIEKIKKSYDMVLKKIKSEGAVKAILDKYGVH